MLRMATRRSSVGTETPIKSMDKKMKTKRIKRRRTREVKRVRIKKVLYLKVDKEVKRKVRAGRRISGTLSMTMKCQGEDKEEA